MRAALLAAASLASLTHAAPSPVRTTSGILSGVAGKNSASTTAYLGIPFAQPPVGALRFRAPVRLHTHNTTRTAASYGQDCPGTINLGGAGPGTPGVTDDCLYLNVWAPDGGKGDKSKAVLVWFYGGGFVGGGTSQGYDASLLAGSQDVVVVTTNYRLTIFGFPGSPEVADKNPGLLDQRMAVEWVRDNIAAFGGDPKRIVLVGAQTLRFVAYHGSLDNPLELIRSICTRMLGTTRTRSCPG
jgi:cholinesterase